jgi:hypothetical protein
METTNIFLISIFLVVTITYLGASRFDVIKCKQNENFVTCPDNPFKKPRKGILKKKNGAERELTSINSNDEFIDIPLNPKRVRFRAEERGWKQYYKNNYLEGTVKSDQNFSGTNFRNYLDSIKYFRN